MPERRTIIKRQSLKSGYRVGREINPSRRADVYYRGALDKEMHAFISAVREGLKKEYASLPLDKPIQTPQTVIHTLNYYQTAGIAVLLYNSEQIINKWLTLATKTRKKYFEEFIGDVKIDYDTAYDEALRLITHRNVSLIKNTATQTLTNIENIVFDGMTTGEGWKGITDTLNTQDGIMRDRVKRIARDQTSKANEAINYLQQKAAGIKYFQWRTAQDERVSTGYGGHKQLNGKIYKWDDDKHYPIIDSYGNRGIPSQRVNCRCVALPVMIKSGYHAEMLFDGSYKIVKD